MFRRLVSVIQWLSGRRYLGRSDGTEPDRNDGTEFDPLPAPRPVRSFADMPEPEPCVITRPSADIIDLAMFRQSGRIHRISPLGSDLVAFVQANRLNRTALEFTMRTGQPCTVEQMANGSWIVETTSDFEIAPTLEEAIATLEKRIRGNPFRHGA